MEQRSDKQNKSGHKYFSDVSEELNAAGLDQTMVLEKIVYNVPNTASSVKDLFRSIARKMFGVRSTAELTTKQWLEVEEVFTRELQEKLGITLPEYPSEESLNAKMRGWHR